MHSSLFLASSILFQTTVLALISTSTFAFDVGIEADTDVDIITADTNHPKTITSTNIRRRAAESEGDQEICSDLLLEEDYLSNEGNVEYLQSLLTQISGSVIDYSSMKIYMEETQEYCTSSLGGDLFLFTVEEDEQCSPFSQGLGGAGAGITSTYYLIKNLPICLSACKSADAALTEFLTKENIGEGCNGKISILLPTVAPSISVSTAPSPSMGVSGLGPGPGVDATPSPTGKDVGAGAGLPNSSSMMDRRFKQLMIAIGIFTVMLM